MKRERRKKEGRRKGEQQDGSEKEGEKEGRRKWEEQDKRDSERNISPLVPAEDAIELDTTYMSAGEVVDALMDVVMVRGIF